MRVRADSIPARLGANSTTRAAYDHQLRRTLRAYLSLHIGALHASWTMFQNWVLTIWHRMLRTPDMICSTSDTIQLSRASCPRDADGPGPACGQGRRRGRARCPVRTITPGRQLRPALG